jgi:hypothetical protein
VTELLNVVKLDHLYCVATWDRVLIQLWRGPATEETAQRFREIGEAFLRDNAGQPLSTLSIVESGSPPPTNKVRVAMADSFRGLAHGMRHQIVVAEGSAFRTSLVRAVGLALSTMSASPLPLKFAVSLDEAAWTLAPDLSPNSGGADGLKRTIASLRSLVDKFPRP